MEQVLDVITRVSRRLQDQESGYEFTRWESIDLLAGLNNALAIISKYRPSLFGSITDYPIGEDGILRIECSSFAPPFALLTAGGRRIRNLATTEDGPSAFSYDFCDGDEPRYLIPRSDKEYEFYPVPASGKYKVRGTCVSVPVLTESDTVPLTADYIPALEELMLYYALSYDVLDEGSLGKAKLHLNTALLLMGVSSGKGG